MPDRFFTPKMAWFTPLLCNSCCEVPIMDVEAVKSKKAKVIYMSMEVSSNYGTYTDYSTEAKKNSVATDKQKSEKLYSNSREYKDYLTEKYDCLRSKDYSVEINSSLMAKAAKDEKTAQWLEYNLSLIPETIEKTKAMVEARGAKIISCNIKINGYDSMTAELCTRVEADHGTEKAKVNLEKKLEKIREEKKEEKKKAEEKIDEKLEMTFTGSSVASITQLIEEKMMSGNTSVLVTSGLDLKV